MNLLAPRRRQLARQLARYLVSGGLNFVELGSLRDESRRSKTLCNGRFVLQGNLLTVELCYAKPFAVQTRLLPFFVGVAKFSRPNGRKHSLRWVLDPTANKNVLFFTKIKMST
jgi:hypothetical protein